MSECIEQNVEGVNPWSEAYLKNRVRLCDSIPLELPLCINIEPANACNFKCQMCWQSTREYLEQGGPFENMSMELFYHILDDIKELCKKYHGKIKLIKLYNSGEPMLNGALGTMLKAIKKANVCNQVEITSNCSLLTKELARELIEGELDYLRVSVYSVLPERHIHVTNQQKFTPSDIHDKIAYLYNLRNEMGKRKPFICAKIMDSHDEENEQFKSYYKNISDEQVIDIPWNIAKLEEKSLDKLYGKDGDMAQQKYLETSLYKARKACRYPFTHMTIRSNGDVVVCCSDWSRDTLLGNVKTQSLEQIWRGKALYDFRVMQLKTHGRLHPLCATCEIPLRDLPEDNIDSVDIDRLSYDE